MFGNSLKFLVNEPVLLIYLHLYRYSICHLMNHFQLFSQFLYYNLCNFFVLLFDRFSEVAELLDVDWIDNEINICGRINTIDLSPNTQYVANIVFKVIDLIGFTRPHVEFSVGVASDHHDVTNPCYHTSKIVCLYQNYEGRANNTVVGLQSSIVRSDGWFEIEMGEFFNLGLENEVKMNVFMEMKDGNQNTRLLFEGIEVRPK